ncbi:hybrid sensor histidine kinase/response regulator [Tunicatimonas pelagia]|uniref:hybrid sensor histidine kinase/response regulator n=1 Tax=Tunicatimonas pelagia TaxID=931531 RepID=UPI0026662C1E|nr:response regulator [Tunicatimonas pelagia]WKN44590.1 response regulator [Tunicatimonas pelagia]
MKGGPYKLLVIETNVAGRSDWNTQELYWENQFQIDLFDDLQQAALSADRHPYDGVIISVDLLDPINNKLLSRALYLFARLPIIILSSVESPLIEQRFVKLGFQDFLVNGQYEISQLCRSIVCAIERKRLLQSYQANPILEGKPNTPQQTETLIADLMATLQPSVNELGLAIDKLNGNEVVSPTGSKSYFPLIKQSKENLEKRYIRFFHIQQSLKAIDKAIQPFMLTPTADLVMRSFSSTLDFLKAKTQLKISCHQWYGSYEAFCEILYQLVSNAIKFRSNRRQLQLQIGMRKLPNGDLKLTVADNGLGIDLRYDKGKIFQLFYQEHYRDARSGDGAGLYIVKTLVDFYRGTININSRVNQGSIISIYLPDRLSD